MAIIAVVAFDDWPGRTTMVRHLLAGIGGVTGGIGLCFLVKMGLPPPALFAAPAVAPPWPPPQYRVQ
jgi:hypothetical protein